MGARDAKRDSGNDDGLGSVRCLLHLGAFVVPWPTHEPARWNSSAAALPVDLPLRAVLAQRPLAVARRAAGTCLEEHVAAAEAVLHESALRRDVSGRTRGLVHPRALLAVGGVVERLAHRCDGDVR